jgi:hypothetical protein
MMAFGVVPPETTAKTQNETPQKHKTKCRKNTKWNLRNSKINGSFALLYKIIRYDIPEKNR